MDLIYGRRPSERPGEQGVVADSVIMETSRRVHQGAVSIELGFEAARVLAMSLRSVPRASCAAFAAAQASSSNFGTGVMSSTVEGVPENGGTSQLALAFLNCRIASVEMVICMPSSLVLAIAGATLPSREVVAEARTLL